MARKPKKPTPIEMETVSARVLARTGKKMTTRHVREDKRSYWQARMKAAADPDRPMVWSGWATREEAVAALARLVARGGLAPSRPSGGLSELRTIGDLMSAWMEAMRLRERRPGQDRGSGLSPKTVVNYDKAARHVTAWLGEVPVEASPARTWRPTSRTARPATRVRAPSAPSSARWRRPAGPGSGRSPGS